MVMRLNIGSTTYSATPTGGVTFLADGKDGPTSDPDTFRFEFSTEGASLPVFIHCEAANVAALKTLVDTVLGVLKDPNMFNDVNVDNGSSGDKLVEFKTSDGTYRTRKCENTVEWWSETTAFIRARLVWSNVEDFASGGGAAGTEQMVDGIINAQVERNVGGYMGVTLAATFRPTGSTTADAAAKAWVNAIIGRSSAPTQLPWLPAKDVLRVIDNFFELDENESAKASQDRVRATIILREIDDALKAAIDKIKTIDFDVSQTLQRLPSAYSPGWDARITGQIQYKRAGLTSFDSNDSAPGKLTAAEAIVVLNIALATAITQQGWSEFVPIEASIEHAGSEGKYSFTITGIADGGSTPFVSFNERLVERDSDLSFTDTSTDKRKWNYGVGDSLPTAVHRVDYVRVGAGLSYFKAGSLSDRYTAKDTTADIQIPMSQKSIGLTSAGQIVYAGAYEVIYEDTTGQGEGGTQVNNASGTTSIRSVNGSGDGTATPRGN